MNILDLAHFASLNAGPRPPARSRSAAAPPARKKVSPATFAHLKPFAVHPPVTEASQDARSFALNVLGAAAKERGERFDTSSLTSGPEQNTVFVTGADIAAAARRAGIIR